MTARIIAAPILLLVGLLSLGGCGGSSKTASNATAAAHTPAHAATTTKTTTAKTPKTSTTTPTTPNDSEASRPTNAALGWNAPPIKRALDKFAACMRQHHIDLPPPNTTGKGQLFDEAHLNMASHKFGAAYKACTPDLPPHFLSQ